MNASQKTLITLLSAAIRGNTPADINYIDIELSQLYKEAVAHQVEGLIYPTIKNASAILMPDTVALSEWKSNTIISGITQLQHISRINEVLKAFHMLEIPVIALKGLVLREYYPQPELRSMSDADILVKPGDIDRAKVLLEEMGYAEDSATNKHAVFTSDHYMPIELHWSLTGAKQLSDSMDATFLNDIWKNATIGVVCSESSMMLSPEDMLIHLIFHMAEHMISSGFGLRQLCDLIVYMEANSDRIDWESFAAKVKLYKLDRFVNTVLAVCNQLLSMDVPSFFKYKEALTDYYAMEFIDDILTGGIFGRETADRAIAGVQLRFSSYKSTICFYDKLIYYISLTFPSSKKLEGKYSYAQKHILLTPVAWFHRIFRGLLLDGYTFSNKVSYLFSSKSLNANYEKRSKLLHWLDLR